MRTALAAVLGLALALAGGATGAVSAVAKKPAAVPDELIVGFKAGVSESAQTAALTNAGAKNEKSFKQIRAHLVRTPENKVDAVAKALSSDPRVSYVEPNHVLTLDSVPNDPSFSQLWGLNNTGQTGGTADDDIDAPEAWDLETGSSNVVVAVTDTGVDFGHPDLAAQQWVNPGENCGSSDPTIICAQRTNRVDDDGDTYVDDFQGWDFVNNDNDPLDDHNHGTHVSGTIGAVGNNGVGVAGVNWNVKIMALKFLNSAGSGDTAGAISATLYAADHGARVASNSWGGGPFDQGLLDAIDYGAARGMLFVAAAGNDSTNNDVTATYPASYDSPALLTVAATDHNDALASFSNYGATTVDLAAPGVNILSTTRNNTYSSFSGTSMATPHVSGAAALVKAHVSGATLYGLKALLMATVDTKASLSGKVVANGRLNVFNALSCTSQPEVLLEAPANGFAVGVGDTVPIKVIGANCALPAGLANVSVTVNGSPVALTAATPDTGLYTGSFVPSVEGSYTVTASVGGAVATRTVTGTAVKNYTCEDVSSPWVDVTPGTKLTTASTSDDNFSILNIGFPFTLYDQTYTTAYVSSNGFLRFGSSAGAINYLGTRLPDPADPNAVIAPFWDDLNPASAGDVYAGIQNAGSPGNRILHVEWFNVPHFLGSNGATFEVSMYEATGKVVYRWLDTDLGDPGWNSGASATGGLENADGTIGRTLGFNQPVLTSGRAVSCLPFSGSPPAPPSITTTSLGDATNTVAYSASLSATGGTPPYTWSLASGSLPNGLTLNSGTGAITGTPAAAAGPYAFTVQVADSASQSATKALSIDVADPLSVTTASLPGSIVDQPYSQTIAASGGKTPYVWSLTSGTLPSGLTLNASTGEVSGSPTAAGTSNFTVQATDAGNPARTAAANLSITVDGVLTVTTGSLQRGVVGSAYSKTLNATGGHTPYTWSLTGSLPPGLALDAATGVVSGNPTTSGTYAFTAQVQDGAQTATADLSITVDDVLALTTSSLPGGTVGSAYSQTLAATGGHTPYTWSVASGSLPPGVSLEPSTGTLSGTPTTTGTYSFAAQVADGTQTDTQDLSITVVGVLTITTASLPSGAVGTAYSQTLNAAGGQPPYAWSLASGSGPLPPGLTLGASTGTLSGTPTTPGTYSFTVQVGDGAQTDTQDLSITVSSAPLTITTTSPLPQGRVGVSYATGVTASGGTGSYTWVRTSGLLPPGVNLTSGTPTATLSGTPTKKGTYTFTLRVTDGLGATATRTFSLTIARR